MMKILEEHQVSYTEETNGISPLRMVVKSFKNVFDVQRVPDEVLQLLVRKVSDLNLQDEEGNTAIHSFLLESTAKKFYLKFSENFGLFRSDRINELNLVNVFLDGGFDFNLENKKGLRVVDLVARCQPSFLFDVLEKNPTKIDVNKNSFKGYTLLHFL